MDHGLTHPRSRGRQGASPTAEAERIAALDVLRGVAVLGILAMNIQSFSMPDAGYMNPASLPEIVPFTGMNRVVYAVTHILFDMKMMTIFSMLFGASVVMYSRPADCGDEPEGEAASRWFRRCGWLLAIGLVHAYLIWHGDILVLYALCGLLFLWWARKLPTVWLITLGVCGVVIGAAIFTILGAFIGIAANPEWASRAGFSAERAAAMRAEFHDILPTPAEAQATVDAFRSGFATVQRERAHLSQGVHTGMIPFWGIWHAGGIMLLGIALTKLGFLTGSLPPAVYARAAIAGYAVGLPILLLGLALNFAQRFDPAWIFTIGLRFNEFASIAIAIGHIGLILWLHKRGVFRAAFGVLAATGRMAFTNYLAQSILATLIFYGYGLGQFGRLQRLEQLGVVAAIWALQLAWSPLWLARFRYGPMEWVWRCLTYWRVLPLRR